MPKPPRRPPPIKRPRANRIRDWRKYRRLTLEQLAGKAGVSVSTISNLENLQQGYSWRSLEKLSDALDCTVADLLNTKPGVDDAMRSLWTKLNDDQRERWLRSLKALFGDDNGDDNQE